MSTHFSYFHFFPFLCLLFFFRFSYFHLFSPTTAALFLLSLPPFTPTCSPRVRPPYIFFLLLSFPLSHTPPNQALIRLISLYIYIYKRVYISEYKRERKVPTSPQSAQQWLIIFNSRNS